MQITSDIELSGAGCTTAITPNQLVQSSSENDNPVRGIAQPDIEAKKLNHLLPTLRTAP
uniref:Uncharacterized protein n=1 Tax=Klebsiella pneumoniae TaxID=573 RepID=A0A8B0STE4_KLEPN|nr:hypothetical protein [Klebsiella pneumoniae]